MRATVLAMNGVGCRNGAAAGVRFWLVAAADKTSRKKERGREMGRVRESECECECEGHRSYINNLCTTSSINGNSVLASRFSRHRVLTVHGLGSPGCGVLTCLQFANF